MRIRLTLWHWLLIILILVLILPIFRGCEFSQRVSPDGIPIRVYIHGEGVVLMDLEEYVKGVVAAEMPASFELEALRAQAVAARTYAIRRLPAFGGTGDPNRPGADISTISWESQAWISREDFREKHGMIASIGYWNKISEAVESTRGEILTHEGKIIDALYFSTAGEWTENSEMVWSSAIPYLRSVASPFESASPRYEQTVSYTQTQLEQRLGVRLPLTAWTDGTVRVLSRSAAGRIHQIRVGTTTLRGLDFRNKLELNSTLVNWKVQGDRVVFEVIGYGHGVGMSQWGANGFAQNGWNYRQILGHYYTGVQIVSVDSLPRR